MMKLTLTGVVDTGRVSSSTSCVVITDAFLTYVVIVPSLAVVKKVELAKI
jgi:hypothetical protein